MKASIIIPIQIISKEFSIYLRHLHFSLDSVNKQTVKSENILLDYNSADIFADRLKLVAKKYAFKYVRSTNKKDPIWARGRALNAGASSSTGEFLFFVDSDCVIPPNYIEGHLNELTDTTFTFSPFYDSLKTIKKSSNYAALLAQKKAISGLRPNSHSHVGVSRAWFRAKGGFDKAYRGWGAEDDALILMAKRKKLKVVRVPTYPIHLWHPTWQDLMKQAGKDDIQRETLRANRARYYKTKGQPVKKIKTER